MAAGYWHANYWHANYWHANYWAATGSITGDYWAEGYWHANYWHANYWAKTGSVGDVRINDVVTRTATGFNPQINVGANVLASTGVITLNPLAASASNDIDAQVTLATVTVTGFNAVGTTDGYIAGDIDTRWVPGSTIELTFGVNVSLATRSLLSQPVSAVTSQYTAVGVGQRPELTATEFPVNAQNNVEVQPLPAQVNWNPLRPTAAGQGLLIPTPVGIRAVTGIPAIIEGEERDKIMRPGVGALVVTTLRPAVFGVPLYEMPDPTFPPDDSIENAFSGTFPSNYEICDRTGFRQPVGELKEEWTGALVREKSWERRNIQDFVRGVGDEQEGSPRPEQEDEFVWDRYPGGVTADDL